VCGHLVQPVAFLPGSWLPHPVNRGAHCWRLVLSQPRFEIVLRETSRLCERLRGIAPPLCQARRHAHGERAAGCDLGVLTARSRSPSLRDIRPPCQQRRGTSARFAGLPRHGRGSRGLARRVS
jgi:hypothetical protein